MSYRSIIATLLVVGLIPNVIFVLLYNPTHWKSWRTWDLHGIRIALALTFAWVLWRQWVNRANFSPWPGWVQVAITIMLFGLIDAFMWLRLVRFLTFKPENRSEDRGELV